MEIRKQFKKIIVTAATILVCYLLQTGLFTHLKLANIVPNILLIVTAAYGFLNGKNQGMVVGFICGLLLDICSGYYFGVFALSYTLIGFLNGFFKAVFFGDDIRLPLLLIGASDVIYGLAFYLCIFATRGRVNFFFYLWKIIIPEAIYTVLVSIVFFYIILRLNQWMQSFDKRRV